MSIVIPNLDINIHSMYNLFFFYFVKVINLILSFHADIIRSKADTGRLVTNRHESDVWRCFNKNQLNECAAHAMKWYDELPFTKIKERDNLAVSHQLIGKPCVQAKKEEKRLAALHKNGSRCNEEL